MPDIPGRYWDATVQLREALKMLGALEEREIQARHAYLLDPSRENAALALHAVDSSRQMLEIVNSARSAYESMFRTARNLQLGIPSEDQTRNALWTELNAASEIGEGSTRAR